MIALKGEQACEMQKEMAIIYLHEAMQKAAAAGREAITAFAEGDELRLMLMGLKRFTKIEPYNLKNARRKVADYVIEKGEYPF
jgi:peroxiredoxin family protein